MGDFSIAGYSVAGEESVIMSPELDVCFDIGKCPREALSINNVFLTHGHADHSAGLLYYFSQRDFQAIAGGRIFLPHRMLDAVEALISAWGKVEGHLPPYELVGMGDGEEFEIRRDLFVKAFATRHVPGSLGFSIVEERRKLKEEFLGLDSPQIVELKKKGVEISNTIELPLVAYMGDTAKADYSGNPYIRDARVLLMECTFFDDEHVDRAKAGRHIHVDELAEVLAGMNNEKIILTHVTRRTNLGYARRMLKKSLPAEILAKTTFLMSREHIPEKLEPENESEN